MPQLLRDRGTVSNRPAQAGIQFRTALETAFGSNGVTSNRAGVCRSAGLNGIQSAAALLPQALPTRRPLANNTVNHNQHGRRVADRALTLDMASAPANRWQQQRVTVNQTSGAANSAGRYRHSKANYTSATNTWQPIRGNQPVLFRWCAFGRDDGMNSWPERQNDQHGEFQ